MSKKQLAVVASLIIAALIATVLVVVMSVKAPSGNVPTPAPAPTPAPGPAPAPTPAPPPDTSHDDLIRVDYPKPNDEVSSPLIVTGTARGTWYFEASFPVTLLDADGKEVVAWHAEAQSDWMTTEFVPFKAILEFEHPPATPTGTLVLMKDNPSGLPEHDDQIRIPVRFAPEKVGQPWRACRKTGCSGQICAEQDTVTDCMMKPEYACYRTADCGRQADGKCGWTESPALRACLQSPPAL